MGYREGLMRYLIIRQDNPVRNRPLNRCRLTDPFIAGHRSRWVPGSPLCHLSFQDCAIGQPNARSPPKPDRQIFPKVSERLSDIKKSPRWRNQFPGDILKNTSLPCGATSTALLSAFRPHTWSNLS